MKLFNKAKEYIKDKRAPITSEKAKMIALTGGVCTEEERIASFITGINNLIELKARTSKFNCLVELPEDLVASAKSIQKEFEDRGFNIYKVNDNLFIINWK